MNKTQITKRIKESKEKLTQFNTNKNTQQIQKDKSSQGDTSKRSGNQSLQGRSTVKNKTVENNIPLKTISNETVISNSGDSYSPSQSKENKRC